MQVWSVFARRARVFFVLVVVLSFVPRAAAQTVDHSGHQPADHSGHQQPVTSSTSVTDLPHTREASGTAWLPDLSPMYAFHGEYGDWDLMGHGNVFLQYLYEGGDRGDGQFGSINWAMGMATRRVGEGRLQLRGMLSLEPWTINGCGYPDLLASGEICDGHAIVDKQHPHDFVMELGARYDRPLTDRLGLQIYGAVAGEPALGPVAFPHRISAMPNPVAPLSHHWLDATHIAFGVFTGGVYGRQWKVEGSLFNGREPDERRHTIDLDAFDSFSARVWYLPVESLALQVSAGHLNEAEQGHDGGGRVDVNRVTASATYHRALRGGSSIWASTFGVGRNTEEGESTGFLLAETNLTWDDQDAWFGRFEVGRKSAHDLDVHGSDEIFTVGKLQAGYVRYLESWNGLKPGVGASLSLSVVPGSLEPLYGGRANLGFGLFVTLRPPAAPGVGADPHAGHR